MVIAKQHGQVKDAKPAGKQHRCGKGLDSELEIWAYAAKVVIYAQQEYERPWQQNRE